MPIRNTGSIEILSLNVVPSTSTTIAATMLYIPALYFVVIFLILLDAADDDEIGLVVIADVVCIIPTASKERKVEVHRSHFSEVGKDKA
jgi:hypothetical protein